MTANDLRQALRVALSGTLGFVFSCYWSFQNGVFFAVFPMFLAAMIPRCNMHVAMQMVASSVVSSLEVGLLIPIVAHCPPAEIPLVFLMFFYRFAIMAHGRHYLFGANGVLILSVMLHFGSYPTTDLSQLINENIFASVLAVINVVLVTVLIPDKEPRQPPPAMDKSMNRIRHEMWMGAIIVTLSFVVFQVGQLRDSLSAQVATVIILFPMHWHGTLRSAIARAKGTLLGVAFGLVAQLVLQDYSQELLLVAIIFFLGALLFSRWHILERSGSGVGFGGLTTMGILFGQYLTPNQDLVFSALYRFSSSFIAMAVTLFVANIIHHILNHIPATRLDNYGQPG